MKKNLPRGYSLIEIISVIVIGVLFLAPLMRIASNNYQQARQYRDRQDVNGLNQAVEYYRLTGGQLLAHSLQGDNTPAKIEAVVHALEDGILYQGKQIRFINPNSSLKLSALTATGQGNSFSFKVVDNQ